VSILILCSQSATFSRLPTAGSYRVSAKSPARPGPWPEPAQFNEAVQNLRTSVADNELRGGEPELSPLGMPMPYAGNLADVYKVHCHATGNTWAVKFFKREVRNLQERYRAISDCLNALQLPFMVEFQYLENGVHVRGAWYPIVKMRWIEGQSLNAFVRQSLGDQDLLNVLFTLWNKVAKRLREAGIAHADLQHGNVLLVPKGDDGRLQLKLIDYDGMYVPELAGQQCSEFGHPNFQHPQRQATKAYGANLDRFSHLAICFAFRCLSIIGPHLWEQYNNGENILFTARDFATPASSAILRELWNSRQPGARAVAGHLALASQQPLSHVPFLDDLDDLIKDGDIRQLTREEQVLVDSLLDGRRKDSPSDLSDVSSAVTPSIAGDTSFTGLGDLTSLLQAVVQGRSDIVEHVGEVMSVELLMETSLPKNSQGEPRLLFLLRGSKHNAELIAHSLNGGGRRQMVCERMTLSNGVRVQFDLRHDAE
jgi:hypothetical protein